MLNKLHQLREERAKNDKERASHQYHDLTKRMWNELERHRVHDAVEASWKVIVTVDPRECHRQRQACHHNSDDEQRDPALDQHPRLQPGSELHSSPCGSRADR